MNFLWSILLATTSGAATWQSCSISGAAYWPPYIVLYTPMCAPGVFVCTTTMAQYQQDGTLVAMGKADRVFKGGFE